LELPQKGSKTNKYILFLALILVGVFSVWFFYNFRTRPLTREQKDRIIERALALQLSRASAIISQEAKKFSERASKKVREAAYEEAINTALEGLKKFPNNFELQANLAANLGDCAEVTHPALENKMIARSKEIFEKLNAEIDGQPKDVFYYFKNEYCYRFAKYQEQYEFGVSRVSYYWGTDEWKTKGFRGYYSQGVGAANYAQQLLEAGDKTLALEYAQKALVAWAQYFSYKNDYYNAYVHYAIALTILGYKDEMMRALARSASLIGKDFEYFEFKKVIDFYNKHHGTRSA
jgi:tetratricopeptide (TPR) repeat protein